MYCQNRIVYTVQEGDSLYRLSRHYHTTVTELIMGNPGVNPYNLQVGMQLSICPGESYVGPELYMDGPMMSRQGQSMADQSGQEQVPGRPDRPSEPGMPSQPEQPEQSMPGESMPGEPGQQPMPGRPGEPGMQSQPSRPTQSRPSGTERPMPSQPERPDRQPMPGQPSEPERPGRQPMPGQPSRPSQPSRPTPGQPSRPTPSQPSQPSRPGQQPTPGQPSRPDQQPTPSQPSQPGNTVMNLREEMRLAWLDLIFWNRMYLMSVDAGSGDQQAIEDRALQAADEVTDVFARHLPVNVTRQLRNLLTEHVELTGRIMRTLKSGSMRNYDNLIKEWYRNANQIADLLGNQNPFFGGRELRNMMLNYLDMTRETIEHQMNGEYAQSIDAFRDMQAQVMELADFLARGLMAR